VVEAELRKLACACEGRHAITLREKPLLRDIQRLGAGERRFGRDRMLMSHGDGYCTPSPLRDGFRAGSRKLHLKLTARTIAK